MGKTLIVILGPTGIGKSSISTELACYFNSEIISADSRQIYKEIQIGTAVPSPAELKKVKHHFIQKISIHDYFNASMFEEEVIRLLEDLFEKHHCVIMTGGSMLYIDAVCKGIDLLPAVDPRLRKNLLERYNREGLQSLRMELKMLDPNYYNVVDLKNPKRILHALEICMMTGKPYSSFRTDTRKKRSFNMIKIGLNMPREELYERINRRVDDMMAAGLEKEARSVYKFRHLNSLNTVGYKELFTCFDGVYSKEKAIELIKRNSRRYARKQLTWFRRDSDIKWFHPAEKDGIIHFITGKMIK